MLRAILKKKNKTKKTFRVFPDPSVRGEILSNSSDKLLAADYLKRLMLQHQSVLTVHFCPDSVTGKKKSMYINNIQMYKIW